MKHRIYMEIDTDQKSVFKSVREFANDLGRDLNTSVYFEINVGQLEPEECHCPFYHKGSCASPTDIRH